MIIKIGQEPTEREPKFAMIASPATDDCKPLHVGFKNVGNVGKHVASGCSGTRPEAADFGRTSPVHAKGAC
jgi:hypothetical protein